VPTLCIHMALATKESGVGDGLGSDRAHLNPATLPLAAAICCGETTKGAMTEYARRFGIDKAATRRQVD